MELWAELVIEWGDVTSGRRLRATLSFHPKGPGEIAGIGSMTLKGDDKGVLIERATLLAKGEGAVAFEVVDRATVGGGR